MTVISAKIIKDSVSSTTNTRLTTMELQFHRFILPEFNTHRMFSRNASSSRAIPVNKLLEQVRNDPMMPVHWGSNKPGMQAGAELTGSELEKAKSAWLQHAKDTVTRVEQLNWLHVHKQIANRLLEPFLSIKVVVTATEWRNFFHLRLHKDAQPEIQKLAECMHEALGESIPQTLEPGEWHLPYVTDAELSIMEIDDARKASVARCARVSYLNHDNSKCTLVKDIQLFNMLSVRPYDDDKGHVMTEEDPVHMSPLEHQGTPMTIKEMQINIRETIENDKIIRGSWSANFKNWIQFRQIA